MLATLTIMLLAGTVISAVELFPRPHVLTEDLEKEGDREARDSVLAELKTAGARDCAEIRDSNGAATSGVYTIYPPKCHGCYYNVYCDMDTDGGGWTVIMRRFNGSVDFYRGRSFYAMGFGDIFGEYHLGLERIHQMTTFKPVELLISIIDVGDIETRAGYSKFEVSDSEFDYRLTIDSYYGDAGDFLSPSNGTLFSTFDHDRDGAPQNCAKFFHAAWWYRTFGENCGSQSNPLGYYFLGRKDLPRDAGPGISWRPIPGPGGPAVRSISFKIRPLGYIGGSRVEGVQRR